MAKVFIEESSLSAIGNAIREKTGETALLSPASMVTAIGGITTGGGGGEGESLEIPVFTGHLQNCFTNGVWDWFIDQRGDQIVTQDVNNAVAMFQSSNASIPFDINIVDGCDCSQMFFGYNGSKRPKINGAIGAGTQMYCAMSYHDENIGDLTFDNSQSYDYEGMFSNSTGLKSIGTFTNMRPNQMKNMFNGCNYLKHLPTFVNLDLTDMRTNDWATPEYMFQDCYSLRSIPEEFLKELWVPVGQSWSYYYFSTFNGCYSLDEIRGLSPQTIDFTSNKFSQTFTGCCRIKELIFDTQEDGTPYSVGWQKQTIELHSYAGWGTHDKIIRYGSGITEDKWVKDDATYQALKDDPDWYTTTYEYSRYNHDSAVNTINSLPDTPGGNTIKFKGAAGSKTDGGAINTLTEEEIAVATAKGWTVTFA